MCLLLSGSNSLKVLVLFDMNSEKKFGLNQLKLCYQFLTIRLVLIKNNLVYIWFFEGFLVIWIKTFVYPNLMSFIKYIR